MTKSSRKDPAREAWERARDQMDRAFRQADEALDRAFGPVEREERHRRRAARRAARRAYRRSDLPKSRSRLYRDPENGRVMGVLAGLADYMGVRVGVLRCLFILGCLFGWFIPFVPAYFIAGFLLEPKPDDLYEDASEEAFWRSVRRAPDYTTHDLKQKLAAVDRRIQEMEAYLTSKRFRLDRELKGLEG